MAGTHPRMSPRKPGRHNKGRITAFSSALVEMHPRRTFLPNYLRERIEPPSVKRSHLIQLPVDLQSDFHDINGIGARGGNAVG